MTTPPSLRLFGELRRAGTSVLLAAVIVTSGGCAVVEVAGATAGAAMSVAGAVVSTGVSVTGKVVGKTIDAVTPGKSSN